LSNKKILVAWMFLVVSTALVAQDPHVTVDKLVVYKKEKRLVLLSGEKEVRSYKIALGSEPAGPKTRRGDHRTPEGSYLLDARNANSQFYKAFHISFPNAKEAAAAKKLGINPGGDIMLHGLAKQYAWIGKEHVLYDWTDGCIAVTNQEMDEIWQLVRVGTPIEINP
jgi:murein L,D-transpeptidase YafK